MTGEPKVFYISPQWKTISKRCSYPLSRKVHFIPHVSLRGSCGFFMEISMQLNVKVQVKLSKRKIAMIYAVSYVGVVVDFVVKKIIKSSVKVTPIESKESTSKS